MKRSRIERMFAISLITMIMFWTLFPMVGYAFLEPGTAITPGDAIAPGEAISGGKFIVPGEVYDSGKANKPGESIDSNQTWNSGQPIIENQQLTGGVFIIPNAPPYAPTVQFSGNGITGGDLGNGSAGQGTITGGNPSTSPGLTTGNNGMNGTTAGGNNLAGGSLLIGDLLLDGNSSSGGNTVNGGINNQSGYGGSNGFTYQYGNDITGLGSMLSGNTLQGNKIIGSNYLLGGTGGKTKAETNPSTLNIFLPSTDGSRGTSGHVVGMFKDAKTYGTGFLDVVAQGAVSKYANFDFNEINNNKYAVKGKKVLSNNILNSYLDRYKTYSVDGKKIKLDPSTWRVSDSEYKAFLNSKNIGSSNNIWKNGYSGLKNGLSSWNVVPKGIKVSNLTKVGGPLVNTALTSFNSVYDHSDGFNDLSGLASTDFAASLTTDVGIGVATTASSSIVASMTTGALAGSVAPGIGTIIGAVAGLGVGLGSTYLINGTSVGRKLKKKVTGGIKSAYDGAKSLWKKGSSTAKAVSGKISSTFSKLGSIF